MLGNSHSLEGSPPPRMMVPSITLQGQLCVTSSAISIPHCRIRLQLPSVGVCLISHLCLVPLPQNPTSFSREHIPINRFHTNSPLRVCFWGSYPTDNMEHVKITFENPFYFPQAQDCGLSIQP